MTYRQDMATLTHNLAALLREGAHVTGAELDTALTAHTATVALLRDVLGDLSGVHPSAVTKSVASVEDHPVALLGRLLHDHPRIPSHPADPAPATTDSPSAQPAAPIEGSLAGQRWTAVARAATLAQHDWLHAVPGSRPAKDAAWSEVADVAAVAETLATLGADLADSLATAGRYEDATRLRKASHSGLRVTAAAVRDLATTGPLPAAVDVATRPVEKILPVRRPTDLPEAVRRLEALIRAADDLAPATVAIIARAAAGAALAAADALAASHPQTADALRHHGQRLIHTARSARRVASLIPGDTRALRQAQLIYEHLAAAARRHQPPPTAAAEELARHLPDVTIALADVAQSQLRTGRWLVPKDGTDLGLPHWVPTTTKATEPRLLSDLRDAARHAKTIQKQHHDARPHPANAPPTRQTLTAALAARPTAVRPRHPGRRRRT